MAKLLWGKVYFRDTFAGFIRQEPGYGSSFTYDPSYLHSNMPVIAYNLPLQEASFVYQTELPPFFDNLVAEGWLEQAQSRVLGKRYSSRFELLLAFGSDCAGAVSVLDPNPEAITDKLIDVSDPKELAVLTSRASLSGIQPKLAIIEKNGIFYPVTDNKISTYIAKFPSEHHADLVANEYLSTIATKKLLPEDTIVDMHIGKIHGFTDEVLIIKRFDREHEKRIHFEEFNQLFDQISNTKYHGSYEKIADFIKVTPRCLATEVYRLYLRILAGILLGNTDMHLKNFAMLHTTSGLRLSPIYDQVAAALYGYTQLALSLANKENLSIFQITTEDLINLGKAFGLNLQTIDMAFNSLKKNQTAAKDAIYNANIGSNILKQSIVNLIDKIWNRTFI
jgi:serine/threonine-protein kinase HipA